MKYYELYEGASRCTEAAAPIWNRSYDVIVSGAGSAGIYASMAAARDGKKVMLIEKSPWCGGMHIQGLVNGYYYGCRGGLYEETDKLAREVAKDVFYNVTDAKRLVATKTLEEKGIDISTSSMIVGVYAEDQVVKGVKAYLAGEIVDFESKMLIDATSEGHVLRQLPVEVTLGRGTDGGTQPFSSVRCVYLDANNYDGGIRVSAGSMTGRYRVYHEYRDNGHVNQYDEKQLSDAIIRAHASHLQTLDKAARILYIAPNIGLREGVLYQGEEYVTLKDILDEKPRENVLLHFFSDIDKHGSDLAFDEKTYQDWFVCSNMSTCVVYVPFPVGAVVPKGWKGFITSGRCLSTDSYANSALRMNTDIFRIGEACGVLASLAADYAQDPMAVPNEEIRTKLDNEGFFDKVDLTGPSFWTPQMGDNRRFFDWMTKPEEFREALSTNCPAIALWSARRLGKDVIGDAIYEMTKSDDEMLRLNAGIALGIMHDERALPVLHEIIRDRKPFYFRDCRRSNQMRSVIAICLCGQMGDVGIVDELLEIIKPEEYEKPMYHELLTPNYVLSIVKEQNQVYYQHFAHSVVALTKIALAHSERREEITAALHAALDDETYIRKMTNQPEYNAYYHAALNCKKYFTDRLVK